MDKSQDNYLYTGTGQEILPLEGYYYLGSVDISYDSESSDNSMTIAVDYDKEEDWQCYLTLTLRINGGDIDSKTELLLEEFDRYYNLQIREWISKYDAGQLKP